ncbi:MAG TPA: sigma factor [Acidimicrobiales bacterium]|nr:sigma factor [Acidimicrobiales bacterium]
MARIAHLRTARSHPARTDVVERALADLEDRGRVGGGDVELELWDRILTGRAAHDDFRAGVGLHSGPEVRRALERLAAEGVVAEEEMVEGHLWLVARIVRELRPPSVCVLDAIAAGSRALRKAAERFDPNGGDAFRIYAAWWIRSAVTASAGDWS